MKTKDKLTLEKILNSKLLNDLIKEEDAELKKAGWKRKEVNSMANFIIKKTKKG